MKLKFVDQPYQTDAVNAICDIFDGCEVKDSLFTIENNQTTWLEVANIEDDYYIGHSNKVNIDDFTMLENVQHIQEKTIFKWLEIFKREILLLKWRPEPVKRMYI